MQNSTNDSQLGELSAADGLELQLLRSQMQQVLRVCKAVTAGDLSQKICAPVSGGPMDELQYVVNAMVDKLACVTLEVTEVALDVGKECKLGRQAVVHDLHGTWHDVAVCVNIVASRLTDQTRSMTQVIRGVVHGDFANARQVDAQPARGEILELNTQANAMVRRLSSFTDKILDLSKSLNDGHFDKPISTLNAEGVWATVLMALNDSAGALGDQIRDLGRVANSVAKGDLTVNWASAVRSSGQLLVLKESLTQILTQSCSLERELVRVSDVGSFSSEECSPDATLHGAWHDVVAKVLNMRLERSEHIREITAFTAAVCAGDLTQRLRLNAEPLSELEEFVDLFNSFVDFLSVMTSETTRVLIQGSMGMLGGQALVSVNGDLRGSWAEMIKSLNATMANIKHYVRATTKTLRNLARGNVSRAQTYEFSAPGEWSDLAVGLIGTRSLLSSTSSEVSRISGELALGVFGGQMCIQNAEGIWKAMENSMNDMSFKLAKEMHCIKQVIRDGADCGVLSRRGPSDVVDAMDGEMLELYIDTVALFDGLQSTFEELTRASMDFLEGNVDVAQADVLEAKGTMQHTLTVVNTMFAKHAQRTRSLTAVVKAVTAGDLSRRVNDDSGGEMQLLRDAVHEMEDTIEITLTRLIDTCRILGMDMKLKARAPVDNIAGQWHDALLSVNNMADNFALNLGIFVDFTAKKRSALRSEDDYIVIEWR